MEPIRRLGAMGLLAVVGACSTVNLGDPPADVNACVPSQAFFVNRIFDEFLNKQYDGKTCGDAGCHDAASGRPLRLVAPATPKPIAFPMAPGSDWEIAYRSAVQQMNCSDALASELFTRPAELRIHGGGQLIKPNGPEALLLEEWVGSAP